MRKSVDCDQPRLFEDDSLNGEPLQVPIDQLDDVPLNPRTEHAQAALDDLAQDIAERGVLQAIVAAPPDAQGRNCIRWSSASNPHWRRSKRSCPRASPAAPGTPSRRGCGLRRSGSGAAGL